MPGYILHLTAAKMALSMVSKENRLYIQKEQNAFLAGSLLPDTVKEKKASHFRNPKYEKNMVEYPDTKLFLEKYEHLLLDSSCLGYYFHLYVDRKFFKEYLPQVITFYNEDYEVVWEREDVKWVCLKRTNQMFLKEDFFTDDYYYGDYTRMNTYLVKRYELPLVLNTNITNPGIAEVNYEDLSKIFEELQSYMGVSEAEVGKLQVFELEHLLAFLENIAREFLNENDIQSLKRI